MCSMSLADLFINQEKKSRGVEVSNWMRTYRGSLEFYPLKQYQNTREKDNVLKVDNVQKRYKPF